MSKEEQEQLTSYNKRSASSAKKQDNAVNKEIEYNKELDTLIEKLTFE
jgi:hypothetical protein